jgi:hypothetical protein
VRDLVVRLLLRPAEVEEEMALLGLALVAVGDGRTGATAVDTPLDLILEVADGEEGLYIEVGGTSAGADLQDEVGDCVRHRGAGLVAADLDSGGSGHDGGRENGREDAGEAHLGSSGFGVGEAAVVIKEGED